MFRVLLPNIVPSIMTFGIAVCAATITAESSLSYLGIGIRPPTPSWGVMIGQGQAELRDHPFLTFVPAMVLFVTVFCIDVVGERLRGNVTASGESDGRT
jgi:peptide/nickel transport system permease protein